MSERRDPVKWVETGQRVEAHHASDSGVHAVGKVIAYTDAPTVVIETDDGRQVSWRADMTQAVERTAETGAEYVFRSNLRGDGAAFLSLHRLGDEVHLRLRHVTSDPMAFEVAVLSPSERRALITALTELDAEAPARRSVRVENGPHGPSPTARLLMSARVTHGQPVEAVRLAHQIGMDWPDALAYVEGMSEYQTNLAAHGERRGSRVFLSDGLEPPADVELLRFFGTPARINGLFLRRSVDLQLRWVWLADPEADVSGMVGDTNWPVPNVKGTFTEEVV